MPAINIDKNKVDRIVWNTLRGLQDNGAHPAEIIIALAQCVGRMIATMGETGGAGPIAQRELVDIAIKQMAAAIEAGSSPIIHG